MLFVRVQSVPRAVLSRSPPSSLMRGFPLSSSLELAPSRPSHEVSLLTATSDLGSDLHRGYLPSCAAPSGFLNLSTRYSALILSALFHTDAAQVSTFRVFPSTIASCAFQHPLPLLLLVESVQGPSLPSFRDSCTREVRACQVGVIRGLVAVPLLVFAPPRFPSLSLGSLAGASSHGL
jgi:hypothetical protein